MTTVIQFLGSPLAHGLLHALGWTLVHFCWQGTIVAAVLWSTLQLLPVRSSQARYAAACIAFLLLIALPPITFSHLAAVSLQGGRVTGNSSNPIDPAMLLQITVGSTPAPWSARVAAVLDHRMPWLLALWLAGAMFFVARLNYGLLIASRLKSAATIPAAAGTLQMFEVLRHRLGINRAVRLLHSARVQVPTVIGWLRPVVLIPASCVTGLSTLQIEAIFCHELAHVRRHDYLISVFQSVAEALLFYHPAVWWISRQVRRERECCCDEIAVANGGDILAYARALSYLEERRAAFPEFALGANGGVLSMRIRRLLGYSDNAPASQFAAFTLLILMVALAGSYVATIARAAQPKPSPIAAIIKAPLHAIGLVQEQATPNNNPRNSTQPTAQQQFLRGIYKVWLNEDAVYFSTPEERTTFLNLTSDEERDKFIEQFWARRNPPGAAPNAFRDEIYARFGYTREHFATSMKSGWETDRGRIYIVYGKPADVEAHPGGGGPSSYPNEVWHYPSIAGIGEDVRLTFVDTCQCGQYSYTVDGFSNGQGSLDTSQRISSSVKLFATAADTAQQPPPPTSAVKISPGIIAGELISRVNPIYPPDAKSAGIRGPVVLAAIISKEGKVEQLRVVSGPQELLRSALDAVKQWSYKPYLLNGQPTEVQTTITVNYSLDNPPAPQRQESAQQYNGVPLHRIGPGVSPPVVIYQVDPQFSDEARKAKFMGMVLVNLVVDENGSPQSVHVLRGVGMGLDEKAVEAIKQYKFKPAMEDGKSVPVALNVEVNFRIYDRKESQAEQSGSVPGIPAVVSTRPDGVTMPVLFYQVEPKFSESARKAKKSGTVMVSLTVDQRGRPADVHVVRRLGYGLDQKAVEAVKQYRFNPARKNNQPVAVPMNIEVNFQIF